MAHSKDYMNKDLTECGICLMVLEEPKALPCLHSYCLKCLSKWAEGKKGKVTCPICVQDFILPPEGVEGFITNFFINTLKDRKETAEKLHAKDARIPCSCCGATDSKAEAYCTDCGGFICEGCDSTHKRVLVMQNHKTVPFADLQSGKIDIKSVMRQEYCKEHKGQVLRFYCKTCGVLVCHECTVIDHTGKSHSIVNLKSATKGQRIEVGQLMKNCTKIRDAVDEAVKSADKVQDNLEQGLMKATTDLHQAADDVRTEVEKKEMELEAKLIQAATDNKKKIEVHKERMLLQQTRLHTALQMASEVTETGSDYDLALVYSSLKTSLTQLQNMKPANVDGLGVIAFTANRRNLSNISTLGSLLVGSQEIQVSVSTGVKGANAENRITGNMRANKVSLSPNNMPTDIGTWKIEKQFGMFGRQKLSCGRNIAVTSIGDYIITDSGAPFVCNHEGALKLCIDHNSERRINGRMTRPWDVVVSSDGRIFITSQFSTVKVYDTNGTFKYLFPAMSPSNVSSSYRDEHQPANICGLALDNHEHLLVGEVKEMYISKHTLDGLHISSFKVTTAPTYIAVTSNDLIIVSHGDNGHRSTQAAQILDSTGNILQTLNPPHGVFKWLPYGLCCTSDDEIYIANYDNSGDTRQSRNDSGIYCFLVSGQYLGCITKEVTNPSGLALTDNGNKLVVVENNSVKIFRRQ